jgi:hypothetical protein
MSPIFALEVVAAFFLGLFFTSKLTGWNALSRKFPLQNYTPAAFPRFFSLSIKGAGIHIGSYPSVVTTFGISPEGMCITSRLPFHRGIFIPWSSIGRIEGETNWIMMSETINLDGFNGRIILKKWGIKGTDVDISTYKKS